MQRIKTNKKQGSEKNVKGRYSSVQVKGATVGSFTMRTNRYTNMNDAERMIPRRAKGGKVLKISDVEICEPSTADLRESRRIGKILSNADETLAESALALKDAKRCLEVMNKIIARTA